MEFIDKGQQHGIDIHQLDPTMPFLPQLKDNIPELLQEPVLVTSNNHLLLTPTEDNVIAMATGASCFYTKPDLNGQGMVSFSFPIQVNKNHMRNDITVYGKRNDVLLTHIVKHLKIYGKVTKDEDSGMQILLNVFQGENKNIYNEIETFFKNSFPQGTMSVYNEYMFAFRFSQKDRIKYQSVKSEKTKALIKRVYE